MNDLKFTTAGDYMSQVTDEQKEELVDAIRRPDRYYRIQLWGYGGESAYMSLTRAQYDFWRPIVEEHGDADLVAYMLGAQDDDVEYENISEVPLEARFLYDTEEDYSFPWYEAPTEFEHTYGVTYESARIQVEEVEHDEYSAETLEVIIGENLTDLVDQIYDNSGDAYLEIQEYSCCEEASSEYVAQMYSTEKGTFFDGVLHLTNGERFDPQKLRVQVVEYLNGEDTVVGVTYNGEDIDNNGGDTNGKGYSAVIWKTE